MVSVQSKHDITVSGVKAVVLHDIAKALQAEVVDNEVVTTLEDVDECIYAFRYHEAPTSEAVMHHLFEVGDYHDDFLIDDFNEDYVVTFKE